MKGKEKVILRGKKKENFIKFQPILFCDTAEGLC